MSFCQNRYYHYKYTKSSVGMLGEWISNYPFSFKIHHPIYSWIVMSNSKNKRKFIDETKIINLHTCFGKNSMFDYFYYNNYGYILFNCKHFTQIHYCEEMAMVEWRFHKFFDGKVYLGQNKYDEQFSLDMYCRNYNMKNQLGFSYFEYMENDIMELNKNNIKIYYLNDVQKICNILISKLKNGILFPYK
jgi:aminoglycoside N3'-acetyltransferase